MSYIMFDAASVIKTISADEARKLIEAASKGELVVLDVREPKEYAQGHIPGAVLMPLSQIHHMMEKLPSGKPVIAYCRSGNRSKAAASLLSLGGFKDVVSMDGGIIAWNGAMSVGGPAKGMELLKGRTTPEDMLKLAWALEEGTRVFYEKTNTVLTDPAAGVIFGALIKAESHHRDLVMKAFQTLKSDASEEDIRDDEAAGFIEGGERLEEALAWLSEGERTPLDVLEVCLVMEANSLDLYIRLSRAVENPAAGEVLSFLIEEEKAHLKTMGKLLQDLL